MSVTSQFCKKARLLVIHNPVAGGRRRHRLDRALAALRAGGATVETYMSAHAGDVENRARAALTEIQPFDGIIAAGGDGTLNEVVNGVGGAPMPVGLFPMGTANVYAIENRIPREPEAWARMVLSGSRQSVHLGRANGRLFVAMVSAGFDSRAVADVDAGLKRLTGKAAYALSGGLALMTAARDRLVVRVDGEVLEGGWVVVSKTCNYAGPFRLVPTAGVARDDLGVAIFPAGGPFTRMRDLGMLGLAMGGFVPGVRNLRAREVVIESDQPLKAQMDGDIFLPLPIRVEPGPAIPFMLPGSVSQKTQVN